MDKFQDKKWTGWSKENDSYFGSDDGELNSGFDAFIY